MVDHNERQRGMTWLGRIRLRVVVFVIGIPLAAFGAISLGPAWLAVPLLGVAVAAVTMTVSRLTERLDARTCWTCGRDLAGEPPHEHGIVCPDCGSLNQHNPLTLLARLDRSRSGASDGADDAETDGDTRPTDTHA